MKNAAKHEVERVVGIDIHLSWYHTSPRWDQLKHAVELHEWANDSVVPTPGWHDDRHGEQRFRA